MPFEDPELVGEFVVESNEHLADIENQLLDIEAGGANIDVALVNTVFRAVHSIKGAAGFMGFTSIQELAHSFESLLNLMREAELVPDSTTMDVMLRAADLLRSMINDIENANSVDVSALVSSLDAIVSGASAPQAEEGPQQNVSSPPNDEEEDDEPEMPPSCESIAAPDATRANEDEPQAVEPPASTAKGADDGAASQQAQPAETNIRVAVDVLDRLMNLAGELVLGRNQLMQTVNSDQKSGLDAVAMRLDQITSELQESIMKTRMQPIGNVFNKFNRVVRDLSNRLGKQCNLQIDGKEVEVDKTIIEAIGDPLTHLVRNSVDHGVEMPDERQAKGKSPAGTLHLRAYHRSGKVRIEIADDGKGISAANLKEKAVSKGLLTQEMAETMSEREAVRLIFHPGFSTAQQVTDVSGRGVGMDVVRSNIEKLGGTVDVETQVDLGTTIVVTLPLTLAIIPSLIVESGSNRFAIPQVNIVELVRIRNAERDQHIGQVKNKEVLRLRGSLLPLVRLTEALGPEITAQSEDVDPDDHAVWNIIVVESGPVRYGLVVDDLFDSEEIVVKPLGRHLKDCDCLSGATILGDGHVALILDVAGIAQRTNLRIAEEQSGDATTDQQATGDEAQQAVLIFTNDPEEYFAVPMQGIARIERVRASEINSVGGHDLLQYRGGSLPLLTLDSLIQSRPRLELASLYVIVFEAGGREVGVLASQLVDIRSISANFDGTTFDDVCVLGSQVVDDQTVRLLDTIELARRARPDWFSNREPVKHVTVDAANQLPSPSTPVTVGAPAAAGAPVTSGQKILLAEDSTFFRRQVKGFLEEGGYQVVDCDDGITAWNTLQTSSEDFALVLTDIEMPNMDGLELTRRIRSDDQFMKLPIVALTSLASQEDVQRGYDAGVTEYQVKLDRYVLCEAIGRLLAEAEQCPQELAGV